MFCSKKTPKLKTNTCEFLFFQQFCQKCKKWSLTPSNISIIVFLKTIPSFLSRMRKLHNFHVFLKKPPKLKTNTCKFLFLSNNLKQIQKAKSNTWKNIKYDIFHNNSRFVYKTSKTLNFQDFLKKTPKLKTTTCKFLFFFQKIWKKCKKWSLTHSKKSIINFSRNAKIHV